MRKILLKATYTWLRSLLLTDIYFYMNKLLNTLDLELKIKIYSFYIEDLFSSHHVCQKLSFKIRIKNAL